MAELRPATTTTAFCYNCHRYLLRPATGFVTSVHFFRMQMFATCNGELQPAKTATFLFCCNRVSILLRPTTKNATTANYICWNQSIASEAELHPWRAQAGSIHGERGRRSCIHGERGQRSYIHGECGSPTSAGGGAASMATTVLGQTQKAGEGAHRRRGNAAVVLQARPFSRAVWRDLGGARGEETMFLREEEGSWAKCFFT